MFKAQVIGLGIVGGGEFKALVAKFGAINVLGIDRNAKVREKFQAEGYRVSDRPALAQATVIAVYSTRQVLEVVQDMPILGNPLLVVVSTLEPGAHKKILRILAARGEPCALAIFPHRLDPEEPEHSHFNIDRVIGADSEVSLRRALALYESIISRNLVHPFPIEIAELAKTVENAYRFLQIAFAEDLKMSCGRRKVDFERLRQAVNTKWNTEILEARRGIGGTCLPKDTAIISRYMGDLNTISAAVAADRRYKGFARGHRFPNKWLIIIPLVVFSIFVIFNLVVRVNNYTVIRPAREAVMVGLEEIKATNRLALEDEQKKQLVEARVLSLEATVKQLFRGNLFSATLFYGAGLGGFK